MFTYSSSWTICYAGAKSVEKKVQQEFGKLKTRLAIQEYCQLYPTSSNLGRFYGNAKLHKLPTNDTRVSY